MVFSKKQLLHSTTHLLGGWRATFHTSIAFEFRDEVFCTECQFCKKAYEDCQGKTIYFAIFDSYLSYCCFVWAQNCSTIERIVILQKKAVRIINFQPRNSHASHLFKQSSILKFHDKICLENILFISKSLNNLSPSVFNT